MITIPSVKQDVVDVHDFLDSPEFQEALDLHFPLREQCWSKLDLFGHLHNGSYDEVDQEMIDELCGCWNTEDPENVEMQRQILHGEYLLKRPGDFYGIGGDIIIVLWCFQQKGLFPQLEEPLLFRIWW